MVSMDRSYAVDVRQDVYAGGDRHLEHRCAGGVVERDQQPGVHRPAGDQLSAVGRDHDGIAGSGHWVSVRVGCSSAVSGGH